MKTLITMMISLFLFFTSNVHALSEEDILKPDEAFKLAEPTFVAPDQIKVSWDIAKEYYLYKDEFQFSSDNVAIDSVDYPKAKSKRDVTLGKVVDIYDKDMEVTLTVAAKDGGALPKEIQLNTRHQGCFEKGLCFPPKKNKFTLINEAGAAEIASSPASSGGSLAEQLGIKSNAQAIPVEEAFQLELLAYKPEEKALIARVFITPDHYLYQEKFKFVLEDETKGQLGDPEFPPAVVKNDPYYGEIDVYETNIDIKIPVTSELTDGAVVLAEYQGCSESSGICYPPVKVKQSIRMAGVSGANNSTASDTTNTSATTSNNAQPQSSGDAFTDVLNNKSLIIVIGSFFVAGLLLAFTPCVFPMIPILSGIIAGQSGYLSTSKAFMLSLAYVLPMALTYAIVGVIAGLSGANLQVILQTPWVIGTFAFLFVILSLSMFGFYELQMPASIQSRLSDISNRQQGGSIIGAAIMGVLSALIVGPCVTAPLISALIFIAQTKDAVLGGLALFALGIGMGAPLLAIGTSAGRLLPRAGVWMDTTKSIFGVLMLALAIWMIDRIVPIHITMFLSGMLLIVSSIYTGALDRITEETTPFARFWKGLGIVMLIFGILLVFGAAFGGKSVTQPMKGVVAGGNVVTVSEGSSKSSFTTITTSKELDGLMKQAQADNQILLMDYYADWCTACQEVEHMFQDSNVQQSISDVLKVKADVTSNDELMKQFGVFGPPQLLFFKNGEELRQYRHIGVIKPEDFIKHMNDVRNAS